MKQLVECSRKKHKYHPMLPPEKWEKSSQRSRVGHIYDIKVDNTLFNPSLFHLLQ